MSHADFVEAYRSGRVRVDVDRAAAARYLSVRLLLPLVMLPVLGLGVGLALMGSLWTGFSIIGAATLAPILIKRSAPHFVITQALDDEKFYADAVDSGVLGVHSVP
ncbi:MAG: hypothetical protein ACXWCQ_32650 [Burkholderiales bacterium]